MMSSTSQASAEDETGDTDDKQPKQPSPKDLLDRIPIAGLNNYLQSLEKQEKRIWFVILFIAAVITFYFFIPHALEFAKFSTVIEIAQSEVRDESMLPFPPMQVCIGAGINKSHLHHELSVVTEKLANDPVIERWAKRLHVNVSGLVSATYDYIVTPPDIIGYIPPLHASVFHQIIYKGIMLMGSEWKGISKLGSESRPRCNQILSDCKYGGVEFPCCPNENYTGVCTITNACYTLQVSSPIGKNKISDRLTFKIEIDGRNVMDLMWNTANFIHFGHHIQNGYDTIYTIPEGMAVFIRVKIRKRRLLNDCYDQYRLDNAGKHKNSLPLMKRYFEEMALPNNYHETKCVAAVFLEHLSDACGCVPFFETMEPDDKIICTPAHLYLCLNHAFEVDQPVAIANQSTVGTGGNEFLADSFRILKKRIQECKPLCDTWYYDAHTTFAPLAGHLGNSSFNVTNYVTVDVESAYLLEKDALKIDYLAFIGLMGDCLGLFLGLSGVAIVQMIFWTIAAVQLRWKRNRVLPHQIE